MGEVYKAHDTRLKRDVAIKVLPSTFAQDIDRLARFEREAEVLASINHPNIASIYAVVQLGNYEEQLRTWLLGGTFPADAVLLIMVGKGIAQFRNSMITFPYRSTRTAAWREYRLRVPGLTYMLVIGRGMDASMRRLCSVRSPQRLVYMSDEIDKVNAQVAVAVFAGSRPVGRLAKQSPPPGSVRPLLHRRPENSQSW